VEFPFLGKRITGWKRGLIQSDSTLALMARNRDPLQRIPLTSVLLLCFVGILINAATVGPWRISSNFRGYSDFRHLYTGATLATSGHLYDVDFVLATQTELFGGTTRSMIPIRLPFYYAFLSPLAKVPFKVGQRFWLGAMTLAIGIFVGLCSGLGRARTAIACCWSWPLLWSLPQGQDVALLLLLMGAGLWAIYARKNWWLAGLLFSLCLIKFNLFLLFPLLIIGKRKWRLAGGFLTGATCLMGVSFLVAGWEWPRPYVSLIFDPHETPGLGAMPNLRGLVVNLHGPRGVEYVFSLAVIGMVWWVVRHRPFGVAAAATLLGSVLLSQHAYIHDYAILIPALLTLTRSASGALARFCALLLLLPVPYEISFYRLSGTVLAVLLLVLMTAVTWESRNRRTLSLQAELQSRGGGQT